MGQGRWPSTDEIVRRGDLAVMGVDEHLELLWASPAAVRLFGAGHGQLPDLVDPDGASAVAAFLDRVAAADGNAVRMTCAIPVEGSTDRRVDLVGRDMRDVESVGCVVVVAHDVTGWAEQAQELARVAYKDSLTGLGNRYSLMEHLRQALRAASGSAAGPAVLLFDLDGFKTINDRYGHAGGDRVLTGIGRRISAAVEGLGSGYRIGGDELVVILDGATEESATQAAEQLRVVLAEPHDLGVGAPITVGVSVGVAVGGGDLIYAEALLAAADTAMYKAKTAGRSCVQTFRAEDRDWARARKQTVEVLSEEVAKLNREKAALLQAVSVDQRTGLPNAAAFDSDHAQLHARLERSGERYSVVLVDVDHFHDFNHLYHYLAGNRALKKVADTLAAAVRKGDRAYRWGGEEFAVLLPGTGVDAAVVVAERIRRQVEGMAIEHSGHAAGVVTVTVGVVEAAKGEGTDDVFESVSALLIEGKDAGRNRVYRRPAPS